MIDYGGGLIFPDAWADGPPDPPEPPERDACPMGCGGLTEDPYGGPCETCWALTGSGHDAT